MGGDGRIPRDSRLLGITDRAESVRGTRVPAPGSTGVRNACTRVPGLADGRVTSVHLPGSLCVRYLYA